MNYQYFPKAQGLYDPRFEKDACGVGFLCNIKGVKSHDIIKKSLEVLIRLSHRGAVGADPKTGDGAGLLIQIPDEFFQKVCPQSNITLPKEGEYGTGIVFLPTDDKERAFCKKVIENAIKEEQQILLGWRDVPLDNTEIGETAKDSEPIIEQVFIQKDPFLTTQFDFERVLFVIRKQTENIIRESDLTQKSFFYINNISSRTISYTGLLMPEQVGSFFIDLQDESFKSALSIVHSRYSTNTFPTWDLAQPFRFLAHNGEINTLQGNINWMHAREGILKSDFFQDRIEKLKPILTQGLSDSATIDNAFELLMFSGRSLPHAMMMLIPVAWESNSQLNEKLRDFYRYHACVMEPWDGPAAIAFTDGTRVGAVLDRNGLRPARYLVTKDDFVVMASELGVLDIEPENIKVSGRIEPGKIFFIDTQKGVIVEDEEVKKEIASQAPYGQWLNDHLVELDSLVAGKNQQEKITDVRKMLKAFGYTREDLKMVIRPMAEEGKEPTGAMGNDSPHSVLSKRSKLLYTYFKQLFAQVTNPAIDPIREEVVMSLESFVGPARNILEETPEHCNRLHVKEPILFNQDLEKIRNISVNGFKTKTISILFQTNDNNDFEQALDRISKEAEQAIVDGYSFIVLSDRGVTSEKAALPALLAVAGVHHYLVSKVVRTQIGLILESAEPREVHHFAVLFGYGADCINPYLGYESLNYLIDEGQLTIDFKEAQKNYRNAINKGILKVLSKMGISTLQSYRGAQIYEAIGIHTSVIDKYFTGTVSRIEGVDLKMIAQETLMRHVQAFGDGSSIYEVPYLTTGGLYQWKKDGEFHLWNPESIAALQDATRSNDYERYKEFAELINNQAKQPTTLRSVMKFKKQTAILIDEVEPVEEIVKRFATGAMSFGSISRGAHETLAIAMNRIGGRSNTGEGGEDPARFTPFPNGDSARSSIKQVASGRFGVSANYLVNADEIQIKIAQGAKPGEGGQLPGHKVSEIIARTRYTTPGVTLISPPPHHDIYSIEDLAQLIYDLKNANPKARISVKLVSEIGVGTVAAGVAKGHADMILISGADGGTGASPMSSIYHTGLPWELGLSETHQTLVLNDLRSRVRIQTDGQMRTGRDVAIAAILGAEEYGFCTSALIVMGCVMLRHCYLNNCSVGVATQDEILQKRFTGKADHVVNYMMFVARELREIMADLGIKTINELIGRTDLLEMDQDIAPWKAEKLDYSKILYKPQVPKSVGVYCQKTQDHEIEKVLDRKLIELSEPALKKGEVVHHNLPIQNVNRTTGAMLSGEVCKNYGEQGLPEDTIKFKFDGVAGQSFGAFLAQGVTFELEGFANDYIGKGISGGKIIIYPSKKADYVPEDNALIGNTSFYGAIKGEAYIRGKAGERFCIRNSGLNSVVEGVGDHGCEYMTGGKIVILGPTGCNFGAGMSGGIAYIYDPNNEFASKCNLGMVEIETLVDDDKATVRNLLHNHFNYTESTIAQKILDDFPGYIEKFVKVMPLEYKRILSMKSLDKDLGLTEVSDV